MQANQKNTIIDNIFKNREDLNYISDFVYSTFKEYGVYDPDVISWIKINTGLNRLGIVYTLGEPIPANVGTAVLKQATNVMVEDDKGISSWKKVNNALNHIYEMIARMPNAAAAASATGEITEFMRVLSDPSTLRVLQGQSGGGRRKPSKRRKSSRRKSYKKRNTKKKKTKSRRRRTKRR